MSFITAQTANIFSAVAGIVGGIGQMKSAKSETQVSNYNTEIYTQRAETERKSQALLEYQKRKTIKSQIGTQVALYGKSGIKMTGSPIDVMLDSLSNAFFDLAIDKYNSEVTARSFENEARIQEYEAQQRARVGYTKAGTSFLSTAANAAMSLSKLGTTTTKPLGRPSGVSGPLRSDGTF